MSAGGDKAMLERLEALEREVLRLRRELEPVEERLGGDAFVALELICREHTYAVPVTAVREVLAVMQCEAVPDSPEWIWGAFAYGDLYVPVIDLAARFGETSREEEAGDVVVLTESSPGRLVGLYVDGVGELFAVEPEKLVARPSGIPQAPFTLGTFLKPGGEAVYLLSVTKVSHDFVLESTSAIA